jgi:hypothetical protein
MSSMSGRDLPLLLNYPRENELPRQAADAHD